jgi:hypothetical protein
VTLSQEVSWKIWRAHAKSQNGMEGWKGGRMEGALRYISMDGIFYPPILPSFHPSFHRVAAPLRYEQRRLANLQPRFGMVEVALDTA